ncbi:zinc finger protein 28-like [Anastrepha ludens]|uniref:zinc finger protein 28-like n=1 Tax=Anastrepha ludens TaxID=28586 RepID=UPI0023B202AF|nr:zinc finger protein 28-like [Anastrepha ludens]
MQCRVCMQTNCHILLDMSIACTDDGKSLFDYYNECTQLQASVNDNFPNTLCKACTQKLQIAYNFRKCALQSHEEFKKFLTSQIETESAEEFSAFKKMEKTKDDPLEMEFKQALKALKKPDFEYPGHIKQYSTQYFEEPPEEMKRNWKADGTINTENENDQVIEFLSEISSDDQSQIVMAQRSGNEDSEEESETDTKQHESDLPMQWDACNEKPLTSRNELDNFQSNHKSHKYFPSTSYKCKYCRNIYSSDFELENHVKKHSKTHTNQKYNSLIVKQLPEKESDNKTPTESAAGYVQKKSEESKLHKRKDTKCALYQKVATENNLHKKQFPDDNQDQQKSSAMYVDKRTDSSKLKEEKKHLCSFCPRVLSTRLALNAHEKKQHLNIQTDLKECPTCQKKFSSDYLKKHIQVVHIGERKFTCDICGDSYKSHPQLSRHKLLHKKERNLACTVCDKRFTETSHFKVHMRIHTGELPFACQFCDRRFRIKVHLTYHLQHHANIKQKCNVCGKEFKNIKSLRDHSYVHTGVMPYTCLICGYGSPKREYFTKHMLRKHDTTMTADELFAMFKANTGRSPHVKLAEELDIMYKNVQQST